MADAVVADDDAVPDPAVEPDALLYKSTALNLPFPEVTIVRR
jgi:hypothetical protein